MNIQRVILSVIKMNLKAPFSTALGTLWEREGIIIQVADENGVIGLGEAVAFSTPWYTEETVKTCMHMLKDVLVPILLASPVHHPSELEDRFSAIRGNHMAKAGLETAVWDLYAKNQNKPLWEVIGGTQMIIPSGAVVGAHDLDTALIQMEAFVKQGYKRIKVKIKPGLDYKLIKALRSHYHDVPLMADANSAYTLKDLPLLEALDEFNLLMIEQPLAVDDIVQHRLVQRKLNTPVCLDESIVTLHDAESAIDLESCKVINIKIGRVGGLSNAIKIHDLCLQNGLEVWCGGMIEFGVSRAHNLVLSSLKGFKIPGDISASNRYWDEDIILPEVEVVNGNIHLSSKAGIGFELNHNRMAEVTTYEEEIRGS
ncbi:o-succinylbenzoate synthase [Heyndrickxia acidicola]|uniref:o-succinylbenzoate synthase n=1 Tax=Heyndrickxia acidicola TaxID=209389 RepID=A0ABU6MNH0_9BACI|nr:o-succinylbenzoate synthase [Heyndrickxia acidicola]MED1206064.1 o-succinylbenzoate synthase [Heyndrickxia acidicola]